MLKYTQECVFLSRPVSMLVSLASLKNSIVSLAKSRKGLIFLSIICFMEPIFLPFLPEVIIAPVLINRPKERLKIVFLAALSTLIGSIVAYGLAFLLGTVLLKYLPPNYSESFFKIKSALNSYGILIPFLTALFPLPLKLVTWTCGLSHFNVILFGATIFLGRTLRYSLLLLIPKKSSN